MKDRRTADYIIYSSQLATYLMNKGYPLKAVAMNKNNPTQIVYFFAFEEHLPKIVKNYKQRKRREKKIKGESNFTF